jgi:hypothetical protein
MNGFFVFALKLASVPDKDVSDLEKSLPALARLCRAAKELDPIIRQAMPHLEPLKPMAQQALDIVEKAYPDFVAVLPTIEEFIAFVNSKQA